MRKNPSVTGGRVDLSGACRCGAAYCAALHRLAPSSTRPLPFVLELCPAFIDRGCSRLALAPGAAGLCVIEARGSHRRVTPAQWCTTGSLAGGARALNGCAEGLKTPRAIDRRTEALQRLTQPRRSQARQATAGVFGSATPSAKRPIQASTPPPHVPTRKGARPGHRGVGRHTFAARQAERLGDIPPGVGDRGPDGDALLADKGPDSRAVLERHPVQAERVLYRLPTRSCPRCRRTFQPRAPAVLPHSRSGNQLIATATTMPALPGIPWGGSANRRAWAPGAWWRSSTAWPACWPACRIGCSRHTVRPPSTMPTRPAGGRMGTRGRPGCFATPHLSLCLVCHPRAASVPPQVFGQIGLPGCLVVDRDGGYHQGPCAIPYGDRHLLRQVPDRETECPEAAEVTAFVRTVAPQLALAMGLRTHPISHAEFARQAAVLTAQLMTRLEAPAQHLGLRRIPEICRANVDRLYHWAETRRIPTEQHLAERDLRPTVIARQVSFGSQSDAGAHTRGVLMAVLHTLKKRGRDVVAHLQGGLDRLADDRHQDPWPLLFPEGPT